MKTPIEQWEGDLEPLAQLVSAPMAYLYSPDRTEHELVSMQAAAKLATQTNCWWATYQAAKLVEKDVKRALRKMHENAEGKR